MCLETQRLVCSLKKGRIDFPDSTINQAEKQLGSNNRVSSARVAEHSIRSACLPDRSQAAAFAHFITMFISFHVLLPQIQRQRNVEEQSTKDHCALQPTASRGEVCQWLGVAFSLPPTAFCLVIQRSNPYQTPAGCTEPY